MRYSKYRVLDAQIEFDFYEFYFSSLRKNNVLTVDRIKEVDFNTYPYSMEIDNGEIIFFNHGDESKIREFSAKHGILESTKTDVWEILCKEYLDTELEDVEKTTDCLTLESLGISVSEHQQIRKRMKWLMFGTLEWIYLGHWDLLAMKQARSLFYRMNGADFYWWTMEIALKGKKTNTNRVDGREF